MYVAIQDYVLKEIYGSASIFKILNWKMRGIGYGIKILKWGTKLEFEIGYEPFS
jgi:hypothetical protein